MTTHVVTLDLPESLYQRLRRRSEESRRSLQDELLALLDAHTLAPSYGMYPAVDEVVDFLGRGATAAEIATFNLSPAARARAHDLLIKNQDDSLTEEDARELEVYGELEEFMALLKIRALERLQYNP